MYARRLSKSTMAPSEFVRCTSRTICGFANLKRRDQLPRPLTGEGGEGAVGMLPWQACHCPCDGATRVAVLVEALSVCRGSVVGEGSGLSGSYVF